MAGESGDLCSGREWSHLLVLSWPFHLSGFSSWMSEINGPHHIIPEILYSSYNTHGPLICTCSLTGLFSRCSRPSAQLSNHPLSPCLFASSSEWNALLSLSSCGPAIHSVQASLLPSRESFLGTSRLGVHTSMHLVSCICTWVTALSSGT